MDDDTRFERMYPEWEDIIASEWWGLEVWRDPDAAGMMRLRATDLDYGTGASVRLTPEEARRLAAWILERFPEAGE